MSVSFRIASVVSSQLEDRLPTLDDQYVFSFGNPQVNPPMRRQEDASKKLVKNGDRQPQSTFVCSTDDKLWEKY